jgi:hypothetical protein
MGLEQDLAKNRKFMPTYMAARKKLLDSLSKKFSADGSLPAVDAGNALRILDAAYFKSFNYVPTDADQDFWLFSLPPGSGEKIRRLLTEAYRPFSITAKQRQKLLLEYEKTMHGTDYECMVKNAKKTIDAQSIIKDSATERLRPFTEAEILGRKSAIKRYSLQEIIADSADIDFDFPSCLERSIRKYVPPESYELFKLATKCVWNGRTTAKSYGSKENAVLWLMELGLPEQYQTLAMKTASNLGRGSMQKQSLIRPG